MPATATEDGVTILDAKIKEWEERQDELEEQKVRMEDGIRDRRSEAIRERADGNGEKANELDDERARMENRLKSVEDSHQEAKDRVEALRDEREHRLRNRRVNDVGIMVDDAVDRDREAWDAVEEHAAGLLDALRTVREAREQHARYVQEIRLLVGLDDGINEPDVPEPVNGEELADRLAALRDVKRQLGNVAELIRRGGGVDSLRSSVSAVTRYPNGSPDVYRRARAIWGKLTDATRTVVERAVNRRLWSHFEAMDPEDQEGTISPSGDSG